MEIFAVIRKSFEGRAPARPHFAATGQEVGEREVGQSYDHDVVKKYTDHELSGMTIGIEHVDADGSEAELEMLIAKRLEQRDINSPH